MSWHQLTVFHQSKRLLSFRSNSYLQTIYTEKKIIIIMNMLQPSLAEIVCASYLSRGTRIIALTSGFNFFLLSARIRTIRIFRTQIRHTKLRYFRNQVIYMSIIRVFVLWHCDTVKSDTAYSLIGEYEYRAECLSRHDLHPNRGRHLGRPKSVSLFRYNATRTERHSGFFV